MKHIASNAELATALFWTTAVTRHDYLNQTLSRVSDYPERALEDDTIARYAADAITDYGFCMENPVDIDIKGIDSGPALKYVIERVAPKVGKSLLEFGNYAVEEPDVL